MRGYHFDLKGFVRDNFGGPTAVWRALADLGIEVKPRTVNKWLERDDVAVPYLVNLLAWCALNEGPVDINRYILPARGALTLPRAPEAAPAPPPPPPSALAG